TRWPADSTAGEILKRAGLVKPRNPRRRVAAYSQPFGDCRQANQSWSADFKGDFRLGDGRRCYPLTISDNYSRFLLQCRGLHRTGSTVVRPWFEWVFREYGLPQAIRTDNGAPFSSLAVGGISALSKWWIQLGIRPERIRPGTPSQNGRHERMHRTLKAAALHPPGANLVAQQSQFDTFVYEYNWERSHEALDRKTPGSIHQPSIRPYPTRIPPVEYGTECTVRRVRHNGEIKWRGQLLYVSEILAKEPISLKPINEDQWELRYGFHPLGILNMRTLKIVSAKHWHSDQ
ncbi:MAG: integrase core domain-containing protein, partial [Gammaproteobacteria bacterium]